MKFVCPLQHSVRDCVYSLLAKPLRVQEGGAADVHNSEQGSGQTPCFARRLVGLLHKLP